MLPDKRHNLWFAAIVVPRDERDGRVKVVLFHLRQKGPIVQVAVGFSQPGIVNGMVCVMMESVPSPFACACPNEHHHGGDADESINHTLAVPCHCSVA